MKSTMKDNASATPHLSVRWLVQGKDDLPSIRFRVLPLRDSAAEHGWRAEVVRYPKTFAARLVWHIRQALSGAQTDVAIIQKRLMSGLELRLLRRQCRRLIYDFDDAVWTDQDTPEAPATGRRAGALSRTCRGVHLVIAGNPYLASVVPPGCPTLVLPTPIDTSLYTPGGETDALVLEGLAARTLVGWMGTSSYLPDIEAPVKDIASATGNAVSLVSNAAPAWDGTGAYVFHTWTADTEIERLRTFAIGLMPLPETPYTVGKGGFKILQYMACGAVPIASAVGFNREIITHGENGFLVEHAGQWAEYTRLLLADTPLRLRMASAARETVCLSFSKEHAADVFFARLKALA